MLNYWGFFSTLLKKVGLFIYANTKIMQLTLLGSVLYHSTYLCLLVDLYQHRLYLQLFNTAGKAALSGLRRLEWCPKYTPGGSPSAEEQRSLQLTCAHHPAATVNIPTPSACLAPKSWAVFLLLSRWQRPISVKIVKENSRCWQFLVQSKSHISFLLSLGRLMLSSLWLLWCGNTSSTQILAH